MKQTTFKFEDLKIYQEALIFIDLVYTITLKYPREEVFGLTNQFRQAAVSIALNIAEGTSRTKKDFKRFLDLAKGSCYECIAIITISKTRKYISNDEFVELYEKLNKLSRMMTKLQLSLRPTNN